MWTRNMFGAALAMAPAFAMAQQSVLLDDVIVSGGLTPVEADAYGRSVSIVTAEEIERRQFRDVSEALRALPGVAVSRNGGTGGVTQVRLRGAEGNHVLVLIDGVKVSAPQSGEYDFGGLMAADIERIEVIRGPQSSLYGSNAAAGVISIITNGARRNSFAYGASVEGGTSPSGDVSAYVRGGAERYDASLSLAARDDDGFDVSDDPGGSDDSNRNVTLNGKFNGDLADDARIGGTIRYSARHSDADDFNFGAVDEADLVTDSDDSLKQEEVFGSLYADFDAFGARVSHGPRFEYTYVENKNYSTGALSTHTDADRLNFSYQGTVALDGATLSNSAHRLTLLGEYERESFKNDDASLVFDQSQLETQKRNLWGFAGEYRGNFFDRVDLQLGARHDFNDRFDDATTFSAGASVDVFETGTRLHASIGTGVTNPTFYEQFGFNPASFIGNSGLEPEKSFGWDIGLEQAFWRGRGVLDVTYFNENLKDEIVTTFGGPPDYLGTAVNSGGASDRQGVEVSLSVAPMEGLDLGATYTFTDSEDAADLREVRRPKHEGSLVIGYAFLDNRATVGADMRFVLDNKDSDFTSASFGGRTVKLDDYAVFGLRAGYRVNEAAEIYGRVENLTDKNYSEVQGYAAQGITGFAGLRLTF